MIAVRLTYVYVGIPEPAYASSPPLISPPLNHHRRSPTATRMSCYPRSLSSVYSTLLISPKPKLYLSNFKFSSSSKLQLSYNHPINPSTELPQTVKDQPQYSQLCRSILYLDSAAYTKVVQGSVKSMSSFHGRLAHSHMVKTSFRPCVFLLNNFINMYCKCGEIDVAQKLFDKMRKPNVISYNLLVSGYAGIKLYDNAINVFVAARRTSLKLDSFTFATAVSLCGRAGNLQLGELIHGVIIVNGMVTEIFLTNSLIDMYCKCGCIDRAKDVFDNADKLDAISWNSLISGYEQTVGGIEVMRTLVKMHLNGFGFSPHSFGSCLKACSTTFPSSDFCGKTLHGCAVKYGFDSDVVVGTAILDMYAKNGLLQEAMAIFTEFPNQNVVMYNAMIDGLVQMESFNEDCAKKAFEFFFQMQRQGIKPSKFTFSSLLKVCKAVESFELGKQTHALICKYSLTSDEFIGSALIDLYSSLGSVDEGLRCFNSIPKLDIVSWTSMIANHVQNGQFEKALALFNELLLSGRKPDEFIISTILDACANMATARPGKQIQGYAIKTGMDNFSAVQNSQLFMYARSGDLDSANLTFEETQNPDTESWSVMISCHAQHGCSSSAIKLFELMKDSGVAPNQITFLELLTACSHGGLVDEGLQYFKSMKEEYGITVNVKHSACVVDLLSRAGRLVDAENFILSSGFEDNSIMWRSLLSACRIYKDTVTGKRVAEKLIELEPQAASSYILLYNLYIDAGIHQQAVDIRELMEARGVKKEPGLSSILPWLETDLTL